MGYANPVIEYLGHTEVISWSKKSMDKCFKL